MVESGVLDLHAAAQTNIESAESDAEAARFLLQAQFAATDADIANVRRDGYAAWIGQQFARRRRL